MVKHLTPRSKKLPGLEGAIAPLDEIATNYAEVRDRRMEVGREESQLKQQALALMKKFDKTVYKRDGIEIRLVPGEESIVVRVKKAKEDTNNDSA